MNSYNYVSMINCNFNSNNAVNSVGGGLVIVNYNIIEFSNTSFVNNTCK